MIFVMPSGFRSITDSATQGFRADDDVRNHVKVLRMQLAIILLGSGKADGLNWNEPCPVFQPDGQKPVPR